MDRLQISKAVYTLIGKQEEGIAFILLIKEEIYPENKSDDYNKA